MSGELLSIEWERAAGLREASFSFIGVGGLSMGTGGEGGVKV